MSASIKNIVKQSAKFNIVSIVSLLIQIPNQLIIGMFLIPREYGLLALLPCGAFLPLIDSVQLVVDKKHLSDEVHMVLKKFKVVFVLQMFY
jgi:hypothetical protein